MINVDCELKTTSQHCHIRVKGHGYTHIVYVGYHIRTTTGDVLNISLLLHPHESYLLFLCELSKLTN